MQPTQQQLDRTFMALSDPTRRAMLAQLAEGERLLKDLAEPFDMTLPAVAKHLKVLEEAGLVVKSRDAQRRPCRLVAAPLQEASAWIGRYKMFWEGGLDRMDSLLQELQTDPVRPQKNRKAGSDNDGT